MQKQKGVFSLREIWRSQTTLIGIIIIIVAAVVIFGGVFAYQYLVAQENQQINNIQPISQTAGWKIYTNTKYGFEFKYPSNYQISDKTEEQDFYDYQISKIVSSSVKEEYIDDSSFTVFADNGSQNINACLTNDYGVKQNVKNLTQTKEINGNNFFVFWDKQSDAAMGGARAK